MQQVYNRKRRLNNQVTQWRPKFNLADDAQALLGMVQEQQFVRTAVVAGDKPPTVIVYTDQQLADVKCWCCRPRKCCILGVDRTFNLGKCYVSVTTFKYMDVVWNKVYRHSRPRDTLDPRHFGTSAELSVRHISTATNGAEVSGYFGTEVPISRRHYYS